jgi:bifunctional NMN adenylyltransferase/nudix hydrolase
MLQDAFPDVGIYYIKDCNDDSLWSKRLDGMITDHSKPGAKVMLYGGRDAFIKHYDGRHPATELKQETFMSGSEVRKSISNKVKGTPDFRAGVIWASQNQYPKAIPTVDIAIWDDKKKMLLMARKEEEQLYRFVGGFATGPTFEADARREVEEETGIDITDPEYVGSRQVDDWRYRSEIDKIVTILFEAKHFSGRPRPMDDIVELKWFQFSTLKDKDLVPEHRELLKMLRCKKENR